jgi:hypothetical protein
LWAVVTVCSLILVVTLVLCVPLDVAFDIEVYGRPNFRMRLTWLFGLVRKDVWRGGERPREEARVIEQKRKRRKRRITARTIFAILRIKGLLRRFKRLIKDILGRVKVRELRVDFRVGLDNPADTALAFGAIGIATVFLGSSWPHQIEVWPSSDGEAVLEGYSHGELRLWPIQLVVPFMRFALSLPAIRLVKILVLAKWRRKKQQ